MLLRRALFLAYTVYRPSDAQKIIERCKKMKKLVSFMLTVCLCLSFCLTLTACGENHDETAAEVRDKILKIIGFFVFLFRSGLLERPGRNVIFVLESSRKNVNRGITEFVRDFGYGHVSLA